MTAELRTDISTAEYHAMDRASSSVLWKIYSTCPAKAKAMEYGEPTEPMMRGTYIDREIFHGDGAETILVAPQECPDGLLPKEKEKSKGNWRQTKEGREFMDELAQQAADEGRPFLRKRPDWEPLLHNMVQSLRDHPQIGPALSPDTGIIHPVILWTDKKTGVKCKAELDKLAPFDGDPDNAIWDLKSLASIHARSVRRQIETMGYYHQLAFYNMGNREVCGRDSRLLLACVEDPAPHLCAVREIDLFYRDAGERAARLALETYKQCKATGRWPGYSYEMLEAPEYMVPELEGL